MEFENNIELLKTINRVDAPSFLFTKIEARLSNEIYQAPKHWKLAFVVCSVLILAFNIYILTKVSKVNTNENLSEVFSSMQLETSNQLYHD
jgi:hypothetical protein